MRKPICADCSGVGCSMAIRSSFAADGGEQRSVSRSTDDVIVIVYHQLEESMQNHSGGNPQESSHSKDLEKRRDASKASGSSWLSLYLPHTQRDSQRSELEREK